MATKAFKAPLVVLNSGDWLKGGMVVAMREKYGKDLAAAQRGADYLTSSGMVKVPQGHSLKAVSISRFGGALGWVADSGAWASKARSEIVGLPD